MKIGIDARMIGPAQTGIGIYIEQLVQALFRVGRDNNYALFIRGQLPLAGIYPPQVEIIPITPRWYSAREQVLLPFQFLRKKLDLLFVPHFNAPVLYPKKFVITMHDVTPLDFPATGRMPASWRRKLFRFVAANALRRSQHIIAVSRFTKEEIVRRFDVAEKKISVIPEAPRFSKVVPDHTIIANRYALFAPYILFVGVLRPHKNALGLLEAFTLLRKIIPDVTLVLAGPEDPRYPEIRRRAARDDIRERVRVLGFVPDEDMPQLFANAACVVVPSFVEGFGLVGLEALVQGVPVVAARAGALGEVLGNAAFFVDPQNPKDMAQGIERVMTDHAMRETLRAQTPAILNRYSWNETAKATLAVFHKALQ